MDVHSIIYITIIFRATVATSENVASWESFKPFDSDLEENPEKRVLSLPHGNFHYDGLYFTLPIQRIYCDVYLSTFWY